MFSENQTEALNTVIKEYNKKLCEVLPSDSEVEDITFSDRFERKMNRLLFHQKHFYYKLINTAAKRVACFVIALLTIMSITTFSVKAFRDPLVNFIVEVFEKGSRLFFTTDEQSEITEFIPKPPKYIPETFNKTITESKEKSTYFVLYEDSKDGTFSFYQTKYSKAANVSVNTEGVGYKYVTIKGKYTALVSENLGDISLVFSTDKDIFLLALSSKYTEAEIIKIAESIDC